MHKALATPTADPKFKAEMLSYDDVCEAADAARILAERAFARLKTNAANTSDDKCAAAERLLARRKSALL